MKKQIFINLPVADLKKSMDFYTAIGFTNNPQFTDATAACMVVSDEIVLMLLNHAKFSEFTKKKIADTKTTASVINSLSVESNDAVNEFMTKALSAGATEPHEAKDYGFMQQRSLEDLDGHLWEVLYMDMSKMPKKEL
ncbi:MAG: VOC family protein [Ferruginibacter sp.]